jgi:methylated-DNA-[protein]-cysteine S-methyltransferase
VNFNQRVWQLLKRIPKGKVTTYKLVARALKSHGYRAVGNACHRNPYAPVVPCHRVIASDGSLGGYAGGPKKKRVLLAKEGIIIHNNRVRDLGQVLYRF